MSTRDTGIPGLDRREGHRAHYFGEVEYEWSGEKHRARAADLSPGGMLIETNKPLAPGAEFQARLITPGAAPLEVVCVVRRVLVGVGMGVEFADLKPADHIRLHKLFESLPH